MLDVRFAFASKNDYLCRRESDYVLSLFSCLAAKGLVRCVKMRCNLRQVTLSSASSYIVICVKLCAYLTQIATQYASYCELKRKK